jgi:hypothetical protein
MDSLNELTRRELNPQLEKLPAEELLKLLNSIKQVKQTSAQLSKKWNWDTR